MNSLITYLGCGRIEENINRSVACFVVSRYNGITDIVIPFLDKYPIHGVKSLDFIEFKKIALLIKDKGHLNVEGIKNPRNKI